MTFCDRGLCLSVTGNYVSTGPFAWRFALGSVDEKAYTLFCCAKDLYLGTKHITIADLADEQLISPKMFGIICNALAIRRFGIGVLNQN